MSRPKWQSYFVLVTNALAFVLLNFFIIKLASNNSGPEMLAAGLFLEATLFIPFWIGSTVSYYILEKRLKLTKSTLFFLPLILLSFPVVFILTAMGLSAISQFKPRAIIPIPVSTDKVSSPKVNQQRAISLVNLQPEVKDYLKRVPKGRVDYDHEDLDKNAWVIHVYEIVSGHTATFNWYYVDKQSAKITKEFNF